MVLPALTTLIHLDYQGKTARLPLQGLPLAKPAPPLEMRTSSGPVVLQRVKNGLNLDLDPMHLKAQDLIDADPELKQDQAGYLIDPELLSVAYYDPQDPLPHPVSNFQVIDVVMTAQGEEKERRPHLIRKANINDLQPVKVGRRIPVTQALTSFVFRLTYQIVHEDGLTKDFLFDLAKDLHQKQEVALLGAGSKGNQPLVIRDKGSPYRAFLYGEIGTEELADHYKLLLLLSDQELKRK
jgi:hypothetical protein